MMAVSPNTDSSAHPPTVNLPPAVRRVSLIGARASGKSTVGQALAQAIAYRFIDADALLVNRAGGRTVAEIFATEGPAGFRHRERQIVCEIADQSGLIFATGGGVVLDPANVADLRRPGGVVVWLRADPATLTARMATDQATSVNRPALTALPPADEMAAIVAQREPLYRAAADLIVDVTVHSPRDVVRCVLAGLAQLSLK